MLLGFLSRWGFLSPGLLESFTKIRRAVRIFRLLIRFRMFLCLFLGFRARCLVLCITRPGGVLRRCGGIRSNLK